MQGNFDSSQSRSTSLVGCVANLPLRSPPFSLLFSEEEKGAAPYLETVILTEVDSPDTVTDWVEGLPSSLHVFSV